MWSNTCGGAEREDIDQRSRSETSEQSGADRNNRNKNRKRCDIIAHPPLLAVGQRDHTSAIEKVKCVLTFVGQPQEPLKGVSIII
jgi:hypothetical protein